MARFSWLSVYCIRYAETIRTQGVQTHKTNELSQGWQLPPGTTKLQWGGIGRRGVTEK